MRVRTCCALFLVIFCCQRDCAAQSVNDEGLWFAALGNGDFKDLGFANQRLKWWFAAHYRMLDDAGGFFQSIVRPGLGLDLGNNSAVWAGYGWIVNSPITGPEFDEHRIWQQWTWTPKCREFSFQVRSRLEQRLAEGGDDVGLRWRQLLRVQSPEFKCTGLSLVVWDEIFFNLNDTDWGVRRGFDQNRMFAGFRLPQSHRFSKIRPKIGYLNQVQNQPGPNRSNHILALNFFF